MTPSSSLPHHFTVQQNQHYTPNRYTHSALIASPCVCVCLRTRLYANLRVCGCAGVRACTCVRASNRARVYAFFDLIAVQVGGREVGVANGVKRVHTILRGQRIESAQTKRLVFKTLSLSSLFLSPSHSPSPCPPFPPSLILPPPLALSSALSLAPSSPSPSHPPSPSLSQ